MQESRENRVCLNTIPNSRKNGGAANSGLTATMLQLWERGGKVGRNPKNFVVLYKRMQALLNKKTFFIILLAAVLMMPFGGFLSSEMMMEDGVMHPCPYMGVAGICTMTPLEHVSQWQQMFTTTVQPMTTFALLLLLAITVFLHVAEKLFVPKRLERFRPRYRYGERVFDLMQRLFARGILHSKAY